MTPLECALARGHVDTVAVLVGAGARPRCAFKIADEFGRLGELHVGIAVAVEGGFMRPQRTFDPGFLVPPPPPPPPRRRCRAASGRGTALPAWVGDLVADPFEELDGRCGVEREAPAKHAAELRSSCKEWELDGSKPVIPVEKAFCADVAAGRFARALRTMVLAQHTVLSDTHPQYARGLLLSTIAAAAGQDSELRDLLEGTDKKVRWGRPGTASPEPLAQHLMRIAHCSRCYLSAHARAPRFDLLQIRRALLPFRSSAQRTGLHGDQPPRVHWARPRAQAAARSGGGGRQKQTAARGALRVSAAPALPMI